jgi:hypothetical protein
MDQETEQEEIKPLIFNYVFHFILFVLILILHIVIYMKIYWLYPSLSVLFQLGTYLNIVYFLYAIFPFILLLKKNYRKKLIIFIKKITFIFLLITALFGLMISIVMLINLLNSSTFCRECPFNLNIAHLNSVIGPYYGKTVSNDDIKDKCSSRRCVLDSENIDEEFPDLYVCNYDPSDEFDSDELYKRQFPNGTEITSNKQIKCYTISPNFNNIEFNHIEMHYYLDLCYYYSDFYRCSRFNKPEKYYNLDLNNNCPETNYLILIYILCALIIIMDLVISFLPWGVEFMSLKRIVNILNGGRRKVNSNNSTEKGSEISNDEESFKKEKTPVIIVVPEENSNDINENKDEHLMLTLSKKRSKINSIELNDKPENDKGSPKPNNLKLFNSERNNLNDKTLRIEINSNLDPVLRNKQIKSNGQTTTLNTHQVKPIEIQINNNNI